MAKYDRDIERLMNRADGLIYVAIGMVIVMCVCSVIGLILYS